MKPGDIVQIIDLNDPWYPSLLIVSEVKIWGVQAYTLIPSNDGTSPGQAYRRLKNGTFTRVGLAEIISGEKKARMEKALEPYTRVGLANNVAGEKRE